MHLQSKLFCKLMVYQGYIRAYVKHTMNQLAIQHHRQVGSIWDRWS